MYNGRSGILFRGNKAHLIKGLVRVTFLHNTLSKEGYGQRYTKGTYFKHQRPCNFKDFWETMPPDFPRGTVPLSEDDHSFLAGTSLTGMKLQKLIRKHTKKEIRDIAGGIKVHHMIMGDNG